MFNVAWVFESLWQEDPLILVCVLVFVSIACVRLFMSRDRLKPLDHAKFWDDARQRQEEMERYERAMNPALPNILKKTEYL